jgi:acyl-CoA reductase-like NAD-dependent aldehyde dehydrogenase
MVTFIWKCAPALAMGNSVIVKPSEYATLVLIEAVRLAHQAGIPTAALQVVTGDAQVGRMLVQQPSVEKITFTGSSTTAAAIGIEAHKTGLKRLSFECGGKGPFVLGPSGRDLREFAQVVARNMFYNQGQICSAPSIVHAPVGQVDTLVDYVSEAARGFLPSHPINGGSVGFMVSRNMVARVRSSLQSLNSAYFVGAVGEHSVSPVDPAWSITPTVLTGLPDDHSFWDTELFAPVLLVRPYHNVGQALAHAAASKYGLSAGVWSQDIDEALEIAAQLHSGNVHINSWGDDPNQIPFGGVKQSGNGREKSIDAMDSYCQLKSIFFRPQFR